MSITFPPPYSGRPFQRPSSQVAKTIRALERRAPSRLRNVKVFKPVFAKVFANIFANDERHDDYYICICICIYTYIYILEI